MDNFIYKLIDNHPKKSIEIFDLLLKVEKHFKSDDFELKGGYRAFAFAIYDFCQKGILYPVKTSKTNGRNPLLYNKYRIILKKEYDSTHLEELNSFHPKLDKSFYHRNSKAYKEDRNYILELSKYLSDIEKSSWLNHRCTMNERSFEIFNDEKFLDKKGRVLLKRLGISLDDLNCYKALEAFFYILFEIKEKLNVLIIENKETFFSILKYLERSGCKSLCGIRIDMLIYGEGKKIVNSLKFINEIVAGTDIEKIYYFGDLDFEGIGIYNSLVLKYHDYSIVPHIKLYKQLLSEAKNPPPLKTCQSEISIDKFIENFDNESREKIIKILYDKRYIPQEALNFGRKNL
ncbi:DUF2220 family protein [Herbivorax sp. ANBcel31]|uniref:Wadjet anti-phage system protein JetD domain-containing protein n=1 Tax=Herbivorax sp. ANBcel31 TaxID=3069754 RepID=UPI0027B1A3A2|nr:Wadjet anti-phage system protein JetD domain-containing protein [Herbivorax sp. ANBcel31]MDQ2085040.1 DUF2220 family protein [Herbivorax sp. ANBcel31]